MREEKTDNIMKRKLIILLLFVSGHSLFANAFPELLDNCHQIDKQTDIFNFSFRSNEFNNYINQHKDIAIQEMLRTGVPASIKLAQGLLESNAGRSTLAVKANNHFGIKCGSKWKGKTYYRKDDDYKRGKLVKSCFRKYKKPYDSYYAHSNFLRDNKRYASLFHLDVRDYKQWAKGLKKAGYATSKTYDKKLIKLIEEYRLHQYDSNLSIPKKSKPKVIAQKEYIYVNDAKMILAKAGDTPTSIAQRLETSPDRILDYNEQISSSNQALAAGTRVFIQKKRKRFRGKKKYHRLQAGESMYDIAQLYGLRLDKLYSYNKMPNGSEPRIGEQIKIKGKAKKMPQLRINQTSSPSKTSTSTKYKEPVFSGKQKTSTPSDKLPDTKSDSTKYHTVQDGETLWRIAQKYGMSVEALMDKNNLQSTLIRKGTILKINE